MILSVFLILFFLIFLYSVNLLSKKIDKTESMETFSSSDETFKIKETEGFLQSYSEFFFQKNCKELLEKWEPNIDQLDFKVVPGDFHIDRYSTNFYPSQLYEFEYNGTKMISFIYNKNEDLEACNVFILSHYINSTEVDSYFENYFNCEKEDCKDFKFEKGRFLYVFNDLENYNFLKYFLRTDGVSGVKDHVIEFQILYTVKDMDRFIKQHIKSAELGYSYCGD